MSDQLLGRPSDRLRSVAEPDGTGCDARLALAKLSLSARLRGVCEHWEPADFDALVDEIARTQLRWADRGIAA